MHVANNHRSPSQYPLLQAGDPACGTALGDMWLHAEYSDTRDGRGAGGKWAFLQAYILFQKALVGR